VVQGINVAEPLSGDPARDAAAILTALRTGHTYSVVRAIAAPGEVRFAATDASRTAGMGESIENAGAIKVSASVPAPVDADVVLFRNGEEVAASTGSVTYTHTGEGANYRAEVRLAGAVVPWIVTNAIWIGGTMPVAAPVLPVAPVITRRLNDAAAWGAEMHATSRSDVRADGGEVAMAFHLTPGRVNGQHAAMAYPLDGQAFDTVVASVRANAPMRVSVQVRQPVGDNGERWQRYGGRPGHQPEADLEAPEFLVVRRGHVAHQAGHVRHGLGLGSLARRCQVRTVKSIVSAAVANRMLVAHAASTAGSSIALPNAMNRLEVSR
jgi:hypothetical protein